MAADPYAALRMLAGNAISYDKGDATPFMYEHGDGGSNSYIAATRPENYALNADAIGAYQSKYNNVTKNADGTFTMQFQNPGRDKYQLLEANYKLGPDGSYQMIGDPREIEQESSMSSALKGIGTGVGFLVGGSALAGAAGLGGTAAAAGSGAGELAAIDAAMGGGLGGSTGAGGVFAGGAGGAAGGGVLSAGEFGALTGSAGQGSAAGLVGVDGVLTAAPGGGLYGGAAAGGGLLSSIPAGVKEALGPAWELIKNNPRIVGALAGGLLGGSGGTDGGETPYTGPMPTITRGAWKPQVNPQYMQQPNYGLLQPQGKPLQNSGMGRYMGLLGG